MEQYFSVVRRELERHGGTVEKFIGDAAMAVFGIPVVHDDDALRAVRAAVDMRTALGGLNQELEETHGVRLAIRTGVNTGEVVAGDPTDRQSFATGAAVATAQRLEAAARSGEILLGDSTYRLVSNAVLVEPMEPLELKGKAEPVRAWRLLGVVEGAAPFPRRLDMPMVGRESRARGAPRRAGDRGPGASMPTGDDRRTGRDRQVQARERALLVDPRARDDARRALPRLRRGGHLLAAARDRPLGDRQPQAQRDRGVPRRGRGRGPRRRTSRERRRHRGGGARRRGDLLGRPSVPRASGARPAGHRRDRRAPVGRADLPRSPRIPRRLDSGRADPPRRPRPPGAARGTPDLDDDERTPDRARPAFERGIHAAGRCARRRGARRGGAKRILEGAEGNPLFVEQMLALAVEEDSAGDRSRRRSRRCSPRASTG